MSLFSISSIIRGWYNDYKYKRQRLHPALVELFDDRLRTCKPCDKLLKGICTSCGCIVKKKTKSALEECPENYWSPVLYDDHGTLVILVSEVPNLLQTLLKDKYNSDTITKEQWEEFLSWLQNEEYDANTVKER